MKIIVGNTGLIGKTITENNHFDLQYNSKNIDQLPFDSIDGCDLFLSCLPATKWLVNKNLQQDINNINNIINILSKRKYNSITLISTIDVYNESPLKSNELTPPKITKLSYGNNRYFFEMMVSDLLSYNDLKIFRLPALFNKHIKKNVLYDLINNNNVDQINSNSYFQWYNLDKLHLDIFYFSRKYPTERIFNLFPEPVYTKDIVDFFPDLKNKVNNNLPLVEYDYTTKFGDYIDTKENVIMDIKKFINESISK